jgi:hypothetical protein
MSKRPVCVHCGKAYGQRKLTDQKVTWPQGEPPPRYQGNSIVVKETKPDVLWMEAPHDPTGHIGMRKLVDSGNMHMRRDLWDGESWTGRYTPFCTLRCALDYARKAYRRAAR